MDSDRDDEVSRFELARKLALLALLIAVIGLPINSLFWYAILAAATVMIFVGRVRLRLRAWLMGGALASIAIGAQLFLMPPHIDEGHNVFLADEQSKALAAGLPPEVYRLMAAEFDKLYPPEKRCDPKTGGCWRGNSFPDRTFAFSADGIFQKRAGGSDFSRQVSDIDFDDPVWLRLGFTNDLKYNWISADSDVKRLRRDGKIWAGLNRWQLQMPYFVMYRFPPAFAGSQLCWHGDLIWEDRPDRFTQLSNKAWACRTVEQTDIGNRIFGLGIRPASLAMTLDPPLPLRIWQAAYSLLKLMIIAALIALLLRWRRQLTLLPFALMAMSLAVIALHDASFIGGWRPLDGGDDGLFYEGMARNIVQHLVAGHWARALEGGESVFYYGGPGLRYLRAIERLIFGDTNLGYLSAVLVMPMMLIALYRRFLPGRWALALGLIFLIVPVGAVFGTSFFHYSRWAARGFADPAAAIAALCAVLVLVGHKPDGPDNRFGPALGAGLLFALALFIRPNIAPFIGIMLGGPGLAALYYGQWRRVIGLCLGFLPFILMPLHNWYFGGAYVLFSTNSAHPLTYIMPPSAWLSALSEIVRFNFSGEHVVRGARQIMDWLAGPSELWIFAPLHVVAVALLVWMVVRGHVYDVWLRLIAAAAVAQHGVALFYIATPRYHFLTWLMTALVVAVFLQRDGQTWLRQRWPVTWNVIRAHRVSVVIKATLGRLDRATGYAENRR